MAPIAATLLLTLAFLGRAAVATAAPGADGVDPAAPPVDEPPPKRGDEPASACADSPEVCGKRAFQAGIEAFEAEDYPAALGLFGEAQALRPHPTILYNVALAEAKLGQVVSALEHLEAVFRDPNTPGSLLERVRAEREQVSARLAGVTVEKSGAVLYVDGSVASGDPPTVKLDPGEHRVRVVVGGSTVLERTLVLEPGERVRLTVAEPPPPPVAPVPPAPPATSPRPEPRRKPLGPGWVVGGGAASLLLAGVAVWSGLDTRRSFRAFEEDIDSLPEPQARARMDDGRAKQLRTNVLLGATMLVAAATTATALTLVEWSPRRGGEASVRVQLRSAFLAVDGRW